MAIDRLPSVSTLTASDQILLNSNALGSDSRATLGLLLSWLQGQLTKGGSQLTQYAAPNATGFNISIVPTVQGGSTFLLLTPTAGFAAGTITLPASTAVFDGQELLVSTTQAVTALTVAGNGATVNGAPTGLSANGFFRLRFDGVNKSWYRVG